MKLNLQQAYSAMLNMLDNYYRETNNDDLGAILGFMSTDIFDDCMPSDPAVWETWKNCTNEDFLSSEQTLQSSIAFLRVYHEEFGFNINDIISKIIDSSDKNIKWIEGFNKTLNNS